MPKDRKQTYSDHQSQAARLKKQQVKTKVQPQEGKQAAAQGAATAPSQNLPKQSS